MLAPECATDLVSRLRLDPPPVVLVKVSERIVEVYGSWNVLRNLEQKGAHAQLLRARGMIAWLAEVHDLGFYVRGLPLEAYNADCDHEQTAKQKSPDGASCCEDQLRHR